MTNNNINQSIDFIKQLVCLKTEKERTRFFYDSISDASEINAYDLPNIPIYDEKGVLKIEIPVYLFILNFVDDNFELGNWPELKIYKKTDSEGWSYQIYKTNDPYEKSDDEKCLINKGDQHLSLTTPLIIARINALKNVESIFEKYEIIAKKERNEFFDFKLHAFPKQPYTIDSLSDPSAMGSISVQRVKDFVNYHVGQSKHYQDEVAKILFSCIKKDIINTFGKKINAINPKDVFIYSFENKESFKMIKEASLMYASTDIKSKSLSNLLFLSNLRHYLRASPKSGNELSGMESVKQQYILNNMKGLVNNTLFGTTKNIVRLHFIIDRFFKGVKFVKENPRDILKRLINENGAKQKILKVELNNKEFTGKNTKKNRLLKI